MNEILGDQGPYGALSVAQVAGFLDGRVEGDGSLTVRGIAPLKDAGTEEMGFLADRRYLRDLEHTQAGALLVSESLAQEPGGPATRIVVKDAHAALPRMLPLFYSSPRPAPGIHPTAVLGAGVELGEDIGIGPYAVVGDGARIGHRVRVGAHVVIGSDCEVGEDSVFHPHVVLYPGTRVGARVILHAGVRLGVDGFGYVPGEGGIQKVPQVGLCLVEDDVEVGANTCIDRGSIGRTVVRTQTKLDNLVHLGHNVRVGKGVLMAAMTGVAGSSEVEDGVMTGGQVGISGHLTVGAGARLGAQAGVIGDIPPGTTVSGYPAREHREYLRAMGTLFKLQDTLKRLRDLEARLSALEETGGG